MGTWSQLNFQDANSPLMEELTQLHDFINLILIFIISFVGMVMLMMVMGRHINQNLLEMQMVEWVWTIVPAILLLQIALPSLLLLYMLDETVDSSLTLKTMGHQWYWSYEYSDFWSLASDKGLEFDAYMIPSSELELNHFRLLDVDNRTVVPVQTQIRMLISSADVLHCWAVPSFGVKADAVPGRLNQVKFISQRPGLYYGQCSEICGANHSFMPIIMEVTDTNTFVSWVFSVV